jgi:hypothetical protein
LRAQDAAGTQNDPYAGQSHPPADDAIVTTTVPEPKPPAAHPMAPQSGSVQTYATHAPMSAPASPPPASVDQPGNSAAQPFADGTDDGIVRIAPSAPAEAPVLNARPSNQYASDPDGDIVRPRPLRPGELPAGSKIWVHLVGRLSTTASEKGDSFRTTVAMDVLQGSQVLIPAGSEIDGHIAEVSSGHAGGHGTMRLQPEVVILADGSRLRLHADLTNTIGSKTRVGGEGTIRPDSRLKRDGIEYGGAVGAGVITGAVVAGPAGALTGGLIGAGAVTVHLLVNHPQAVLESGATLVFELTDPLFLTPAASTGN